MIAIIVLVWAAAAILVIAFVHACKRANPADVERPEWKP